MLRHELEWRGRRVRWDRLGDTGPDVVLCHGTPWSSWLWRPVARSLAVDHRVHLWDMPGYGESSKDPEHRVSLDVQGELLADLAQHWGLDRPHVLAHDIGGAVTLRAHLLHGMRLGSVALVDVVALAPWGSPFFALVQEHAEVFVQLPDPIHEGVVRAYVQGAAHRPLAPHELDALVEPWLGDLGRPAFYRQVAQADERHTGEVEPLYPTLRVPTLVVWGRDDAWIPVDRAQRLHATVPGSRLEVLDDAGHLVHLDRPDALLAVLRSWLDEVTRG